MRSRYRNMLDNKHKWITKIAPTMDIGTMATMFDEPIEIMMGYDVYKLLSIHQALLITLLYTV